MNNSVKTALAVGLVTALGAGGVALVANAEGKLPAAGRIAQAVDSKANEGPDNEANEGPENEAENDAEDAQAMAQYQSLAKITPERAQQAAEAAQGGTATKVELDEQDGSLVYKVKFANAEVLIDAGNGKVLQTEVDGTEESDATETPIQGSIQVPDSDGGDGQGDRAQ